MLVAIEYRADPNIIPSMDTIEEGCKSLGFSTVRCKGPMSGKSVKLKYGIPECDVAVIWNGYHNKYNKIMKSVKDRKIKHLYAELGWMPQKKTFQLDNMGINYNASWVKNVHIDVTGEEIKIEDGPILVPLQWDGDTQITKLSPWFKSSYEFVKFLKQFDRDFIIRHHPRYKPNQKVVKLIKSSANLYEDRGKNLGKSMENCAAVACINSTCGVKAISLNKFLMCFGLAVYSHKNVCYNYDGNIDNIRTILNGAGDKCIFKGSQDVFIDILKREQWGLDQTDLYKLKNVITNCTAESAH